MPQPAGRSSLQIRRTIPGVIWETAAGAYTLYAIEDGWTLRNPTEQFPGADPAAWTDLEEGKLRVTFGCFLLTDGTRNLMIDTGIGAGMSALPGEGTGGQLPQALAMIGVRPEDVQTVIHTHLHLDHCGGNRTSTGELLFPNATYRVHPAELDFWMHAEEHPGAEAVQGVMAELVDAGWVEPIEPGAELAGGVRAIETPGHTPGHVSVEVASQGSRLFVTGDVIHHPIQVSHPEWGVAFDLDADAAEATRRRVLDELAGSGTEIAAGHFPRPGIGYVEVTETGRVYATGTPMQVG